MNAEKWDLGLAVLTLALESSGYWANESCRRINIDRNSNGWVLRVEIWCRCDGKLRSYILRCGDMIAAMKEGCEMPLSPEIKEQFQAALKFSDPSFLDAQGADAALQIAMFGDIVYG